jgi:hypothetical protein
MYFWWRGFECIMFISGESTTVQKLFWGCEATNMHGSTVSLSTL